MSSGSVIPGNNSADYDIIIRGGTIVDGTRTPRYVGDISVKNGKIAQIGGLRRTRGAQELDARGLIVAPGFVDLHTHYDAQLYWDPYCSLSGWHGVTTVVIGNCGFGFAPCRVEDQERAMLTLTRNEAIPYDSMKLGMTWEWTTFPEFLDSVERLPKGLNVASFVPLAPLYVWVMGVEAAKNRRPTEEELGEMCRLVQEGIDVGGCGWSAQVDGPYSSQRDYDGTPMITDLMTERELSAFAKVMADHGDGTVELAYHERDERGIRLEEGLRFYEEIAKVCRRPMLYQIVVALENDPEQHRRMLRWLEDCHRRGLPIYGQGETDTKGLEFTFKDWNLFDTSPNWREATLGSPTERKHKMEDPALRAALKAEWDAGIRPSPGQTEGSLEGPLVMEVAHPELQRYVGLRVGEIAAQEEKHVVDALLDLVVADDLETEFYWKRNRHDPEYTAELLRSPYTLPGISDGGAHVKFQPAGSYTTETITWLVRDTGVLSLEDAHYKLSYLPAFVGGIRDRGFIREGAPADIIVYDLEKLTLLPVEVAHDLPGGDWRRVQGAEGYRWTLVNGQVTFEDGNPSGALPGKLLRHGRG